MRVGWVNWGDKMKLPLSVQFSGAITVLMLVACIFLAVVGAAMETVRRDAAVRPLETRQPDVAVQMRAAQNANDAEVERVVELAQAHKTNGEAELLRAQARGVDADTEIKLQTLDHEKVGWVGVWAKESLDAIVLSYLCVGALGGALTLWVGLSIAGRGKR